jgi:hypothetical protein
MVSELSDDTNPYDGIMFVITFEDLKLNSRVLA